MRLAVGGDPAAFGALVTPCFASSDAPESAATPSRALRSTTASLVRPTGVGGVRGYDGAKRVNGRERHILVDPGGLVLRAQVHTADTQDGAGVPLFWMVPTISFSALSISGLTRATRGAAGTGSRRNLGGMSRWFAMRPIRGVSGCRSVTPVTSTRLVQLAAVPPMPKVFRDVLPRRWVVERTFAWLCQTAASAEITNDSVHNGRRADLRGQGRFMLRRLARSLLLRLFSVGARWSPIRTSAPMPMRIGRWSVRCQYRVSFRHGRRRCPVTACPADLRLGSARKSRPHGWRQTWSET